jgi:hypothetical protein
LASVTNSADKHGDVSTLTAAVRVKLVKYEEVKSLGGVDQLPSLLGTGEHQFEHHVVGQQDVGRISQDGFAGVALFLAGVTGERHRFLALAVSEPQELLEFEDLAVGEGVHRVDDDRLDPGLARLLA